MIRNCHRLSFRFRAKFRLLPLCGWILLVAAPTVRAQQWPAYPGGGYYPGYQQMPRYYPAYAPNPYYPAQQAAMPGAAYYKPNGDPPAPSNYYANPSYATQSTPLPAVTSYNDGQNNTYYGQGPEYAGPGMRNEQGNTGGATPASERKLSLRDLPFLRRAAAAETPPTYVQEKKLSLRNSSAKAQDDITAEPPSAAQVPNVNFYRPRDDRFWVSADYVGGFIRPLSIPVPLATTGSTLDVAPGGIGNPSTRVLLGDTNVHFGMQSGVRLEAGLFLGEGNRFSLDWNGFYLAPKTVSSSVMSDANGSPVLSRPIFNVTTGLEGVFLNSFPGAIAGTITVDTKSELTGLEFNGRYHVYCLERLHADALLGFRYMRLSERVTIGEHINPLVDNFLSINNNPVNAPNSLSDLDSFQTTNSFYGGQLGGRLSWEQCWWSVDTFAKVALGLSREQTSINGSTTLITPAGNQSVPGGILALPSNIGSRHRNVFGVIPEFGISLGVNVTDHLRLKVGYSFLFWNDVLRPGSQIDRNVSPGQIPGSPNFGVLGGPTSPIYHFRDETFWIHTLNLGVEMHF